MDIRKAREANSEDMYASGMIGLPEGAKDKRGGEREIKKIALIPRD